MTVEYLRGDLFLGRANLLVNPVNCQGAMGRGLAREFLLRYPRHCSDYMTACHRGFVKPGDVMVSGVEDSDLAVAHIATKNYWRHPSRLEWVERGLLRLRDHLLLVHRGEADIIGYTVALPAIGCGLGGLEWADVKPLIDQHLGDLEDSDILVYQPRSLDGPST